jgi:signal transduction histidine kinase
MKRLVPALWRDTLFRRLFLLMWAALVGSHLVAFGLVRQLPPPWGMGTTLLGPGPGLPPLATLPPGGPLPDLRQNGVSQPPASGPAVEDPDDEAPGPGGDPPGLPARVLWFDYGVRFLLLGLMAWVGARWLTVPVRRLATVSAGLAEGLRQRRPVPLLDEATGTVEVRQAAQAFNAMALQLREQFDAQALLMASISHDLRTPLTRLRLRLETSEADASGATRNACIDDVHQMDALIGSVLQMIRAQQQRQPPQQVAVHALLQALVDDLADQGHDATLAPAAAEAEQATVLVDPLALQRAIGNLLGNALRYGQVARVALVQDHDAVVVTVDDEGPGIPDQELEAVFQPFYRASATREGSVGAPPGGTGLGLYIARDLLRHDRGELGLANRPEGGLRATVRLPRPA